MAVLLKQLQNRMVAKPVDDLPAHSLEIQYGTRRKRRGIGLM
jgi:hypothetical protein